MTAVSFAELVVAEPLWTRERRICVGLAVAGVAAAVGFGALATGEAARFTLTNDPAGASVSIDGMVGAVLFGLLGAAAGAALIPRAARRWFAWLLGAGIVCVLLSFLCWQISSAP